MLIFRAWATCGCTTRTNRTTCQGPLSRLCDRVVSIGQPQGNGESHYKIAIFSKSQKNWGGRPVPEGEAGGELEPPSEL